MITITVKQQKEIYKLMVQIREKSKLYCSVNYDYSYHNIKTIVEFNYYRQDTGHEHFESPDKLIVRLKGVINELNRN